MELRNFVAQSLTQIAEAIIDANKALAETDAFVNPSNIHVCTKMEADSYAALRMNPGDRAEERTVELIEFDIAVAASEESSKGGGISVGIASLGVGGKIKHESTAGTESRIRFKVPMVFPAIRATRPGS